MAVKIKLTVPAERTLAIGLWVDQAEFKKLTDILSGELMGLEGLAEVELVTKILKQLEIGIES